MKKTDKKYQNEREVFSDWKGLDQIKLFDEGKAWKRITQETGVKGATRVVTLRPLLKYAAIFILVFGFAFVLYQYLIADLHIENSTLKGQVVLLDDNSEIILAPGAELSFKRSYDWLKRDVELKGDAYFNISPDASKSFYLSFEGGEIEVLGTSFYVAGQNKSNGPKVELVEGKIKLVMGEKSSKMVAGESMHVSGRDLVFGKFDSSVKLAKEWENEVILLDNISVGEACRIINEVYGKKVIEHGNIANVEDCIIHTNFKIGSLDKFIEELNIIFKIKIRSYKGRFTIEKINC